MSNNRDARYSTAGRVLGELAIEIVRPTMVVADVQSSLRAEEMELL